MKFSPSKLLALTVTNIVCAHRLDSDQYFVNKLTPEHADYISEYWTFVNEDILTIKRYFRHVLTTYDISAGVFAKANPSYPVSWTFYSDIGHLLHLYTLPEYRRKNFPLCLVANIYAQIMQQGIVPVGEQFKYSPNAEKYGKFIADTAWRDSITGEYYRH